MEGGGVRVPRKGAILPPIIFIDDYLKSLYFIIIIITVKFTLRCVPILLSQIILLS